MKPHLPLTLLALVSLLSEVHAQQPATHENPDPTQTRASLQQAATNLYRTVRREHIYGLPTDERMRELSLFLTPALQSILVSAITWQDRQVQLHPDEKPELVETDLFSSHDAGPTHWEFGEIYSAPSVDATVEVKCTFKEEGQPDMKWSDHLVFKDQNGRWFLDDIRFGGSWVGASKNLRALLPGGRQQTETHLSPDERWRVTLVPDGKGTRQVLLAPAGQTDAAPIPLLDRKDLGAAIQVSVLWSPNNQKVAVSYQDKPDFGRTLIYQRVKDQWQAVKLVTLFPEELKNLADNGFQARVNREVAHHWQDLETLVIDAFGHYTKAEEFDGYAKQVSVAIRPDGTTQVTGIVEKAEL